MTAEAAAASEYLHGYSAEEQRRLVAQSEYWRHTLIRPGSDYRAGERVLEVGCAAGTTLGVLATEFPGIRVAGLDREERQIAFAREHLRSLGVEEPDLRVGDAAALPWEDGRFQHVFTMWFLEHLRDALPALREARRVLASGGTLTATETDYSTFRVEPADDDYDYLARAQCDHFARYGNAFVGRQLGNLLTAAGFLHVTSRPVGFHWFRGDDPEGLRAHAEYFCGFLEPAVPVMARALGRDEARLRRGVAHLRRLADLPQGAITQIVYRAQGVRP